MTAVYLAAFIVGALAVLSALVLTDFDIGGGHADGMPFLSLTGVAAGLLGAGAGGLIANWVGLGGLVGISPLTVAKIVEALKASGIDLPAMLSRNGEAAEVAPTNSEPLPPTG